MKICEGVEYVSTILYFGTNVGDWLETGPTRFVSEEIVPGTHWIVGL
jgi:hypothetical protein